MATVNGHANQQLKNPGAFEAPAVVRTLLLAFLGIGLASFAVGVAKEPLRTWVSFVHNHFYFMSIAIGGLFFAAIQWLTGAMWSAPIRRLSESFTAYLPIALVTLLILYFGMHHLYVWTHAEHVRSSVALQGKSGYLNTVFFFIRNIVAILIWIFFAKKMVGNSVTQDASKDVKLTLKNKSLAPAFLIFFGLTFTMASFDQLMSLDPHWYSTMFGIYCFAGLFYSVLALTCVLAVILRSTGHLEGLVTDDHLHDLGKFMFAFTVFWAYIGFSQFLLIWYANLPEETSYYLHRFHENWWGVSVFLLVGKFLTPFFLLMPRGSKRCPKMLLGVGIFMLIAQWIDVMWMIQPEFYKSGPVLGWIELGMTLGFIGIFGLAVLHFLGRNTIVAIGDPKLAESVFHHHQ